MIRLFLFFIALLIWISNVYVAHGAPPQGTPQNTVLSNWYKTLQMPGTTTGCCDDSDCRVVQVKFENGYWWAFLDPANHKGAPEGGQWIIIPPRAIVPDRMHPAGSAVLCWLAFAYFEMSVDVPKPPPEMGILCFVPPGVGG